MTRSDTETECRRSIAEAAHWHFVAQHAPKPLDLFEKISAFVCAVFLLMCVISFMEKYLDAFIGICAISVLVSLIALWIRIIRMNNFVIDIRRRAKQGERH